MKIVNTLKPYLRILVALGLTAYAAYFGPELFQFFHGNSEAELIITCFEIASICLLSFAVFYLVRGTQIPSFVLAIFFGMAAQPLLKIVVDDPELLYAIVSIGATLILFAGGLETPFHNFKKLFFKINSLAFIGLSITAILFACVAYYLGQFLGSPIPVISVVLLGAVLSSTDPAAIIPILKTLNFKNRDVKDIVVSESALTDVSGTLLTMVFLAFLLGGGQMDSIAGAYQNLLTPIAGIFLLKEVIYGMIFGSIGYLLLETLQYFKKSHDHEFEADAAYFIAVPILIFSGALMFGGSGYLAAFIAGLLFQMKEHLKESEHFFNRTIDGFLKPAIFLLLGALVDLHSLWSYAPVGILGAIIFMAVIRPIAVFASLQMFSLGSKGMTFKELLFISCVRETGAIPAVLLVTIVSSGLQGVDGLLQVGMWVILLTLIVEPPLTAWVANKLKVAEKIKDEFKHEVDTEETYVVLGSRGKSFVDRLPLVIDWALRHSVQKVMVLHCLEDKRTDAAELEIQEKFKELRIKAPLELELVQRGGFLQENIRQLAEGENTPSMVFVGAKILDFRHEELKKLKVPFYFLD